MQTAIDHPLHSTEILGKGVALHLDHKALRNSLYNISVFSGVTGLLNCDQCGECGEVTCSDLRFNRSVQLINGLEPTIIHSRIHS